VTKFAQGSANEAFDLNDLSGLQRALMREALVAAFTRDAFDQLLQDNDASKRLEILVADGALRTQLFELVLLSQQEDGPLRSSPGHRRRDPTTPVSRT